MSLHVGLNARTLSDPSRRGFNRYTASLAGALSALGGVRVSLLSDLPLHPTHLAGLRADVVVQAAPRHVWWEQHVLPGLIWELGLDVFHAPASIGLPWRKVCPYVLTLHDVIGHAAPGLVPSASLAARLHCRMRERIALGRADVVITDSQHSKRDIVRLMSVAPERITVIHAGADERFRVFDSPLAVSAVLHRYGLAGRYVLYVGGFDPRKNVAALIEAYARSRAAKEVDLVLVGQLTAEVAHLSRRARALGVDSRTRLAGYVPDDDLPALYNGAAVFVYPSVYEGFGLQLAEAMACGVPVVSSNRTSLPEVLDGAGILVDPEEMDAMADAIDAVVFDDERAQAMRERGLAVVQGLSWARAARETVAVYGRVTGRTAA